MTPTLQRVFLKEFKQAWLMNAFQAGMILKFGSICFDICCANQGQ
jgi:hypothetical protein